MHRGAPWTDSCIPRLVATALTHYLLLCCCFPPGFVSAVNHEGRRRPKDSKVIKEGEPYAGMVLLSEAHALSHNKGERYVTPQEAHDIGCSIAGAWCVVCVVAGDLSGG